MGRLISAELVLRAGYDETTIMQAWEALLEGAEEMAHAALPVRPAIHDSWYRCATGGIDAHCNEAPIETDKEAVAALAESNCELLAASDRPFSAIGRLLNGTGAMLVLADSEGVLIDVIGDKRTIFDGMDIHLGIGGKWTEDVVGTNGIGTALWTGEPVFVHAAEHFCAGIKNWTCAGAPIRDPFDGKVIGVVDLSGHPEIFRPHNIALVTAAAREIERALADSQNQERVRLLETFITSVSHYRSSDGVMIVDHHGRAIYSNNVPVAERQRFSEAIRQQKPSRSLELGSPGGLDSILMALPRDAQSCNICPLKLDGAVRGAALVFSKTLASPKASSSPKTSSGPAASTLSSAARGKLSRRLREACARIIGESEALLAAVDIACRVAHTEKVTSLLIEGETGVGKELFARLIHAGSQKSAAAPFITLNCGAIVRDLCGSELFGHVGGAFTGASRDGKPGVFELANGGVLTFDEIGEMPLDIQPFLLRVLEERVIHRLGDSRPRPVDVRLIAATNRDLKAEVAAGRFRRDLFYRISAVSIQVPPLRERGSDCLLLIEHFNRMLATGKGSAPLHFSAPACDALLAYGWPGNVRELRNLVERLHLLSTKPCVDLHDLPQEIATPDLAAPPTSLEDAERQILKNALAAEHGNLSKVAQRLRVSRPTLYRKLEQFGIKRSFV